MYVWNTHLPVAPSLPWGLLYQKLGHLLLSGTSNQTSCPQSSSDGMWASPYCTQSLFSWYNSAQSENHVSTVWSNVQVKVYVKLQLHQTMLCVIHHTSYSTVWRWLWIVNTEGLLTHHKGKYQASGMVKAADNTKSHYTVTAVQAN